MYNGVGKVSDENMMTSQTITREDLHRELQHYATKEDLAHMETRLIKWMIGSMLSAVFGSVALAASITFAALRLAG